MNKFVGMQIIVIFKILGCIVKINHLGLGIDDKSLLFFDKNEYAETGNMTNALKFTLENKNNRHKGENS